MVSTEEKAEWLERIRDIFDNKIPFNRVLGLKVHSINMERPKIRFAMHDALVGNYTRGSLHGGVISAVIDVTGGLSAFMGLQKKLAGEPLDIKLEKFRKLGTIDQAIQIDHIGVVVLAVMELERLGQATVIDAADLLKQTLEVLLQGVDYQYDWTLGGAGGVGHGFLCTLLCRIRQSSC